MMYFYNFIYYSIRMYVYMNILKLLLMCTYRFAIIDVPYAHIINPLITVYVYHMVMMVIRV